MSILLVLFYIYTLQYYKVLGLFCPKLKISKSAGLDWLNFLGKHHTCHWMVLGFFLDLLCSHLKATSEATSTLKRKLEENHSAFQEWQNFYISFYLKSLLSICRKIQQKKDEIMHKSEAKKIILTKENKTKNIKEKILRKSCFY